MKIKSKKKRNPYISIILVGDAKHKPKTFRIPKWSLYSLGCMVLITCLTISGMVSRIQGLSGRLAKEEGLTDRYSHRLADNADIVKNLEEDLAYYAKELKSIVDIAHSFDEKTASIAENNGQIIEKVGYLLGLDSVKIESVDYISPLASRSGARPKLDIEDATLELNHALAVNEFVEAGHKVSEVEESTSKLMDKISEMEGYLKAYPSILPVEGRITCHMGTRTNPFGGNSREYHSGLDLSAKVGTDVKATGKGKVIYSGYSGGYGRLVIVDHGYNMKTYYGHNSKLLVKVGDIVKRGDIVAKSGNTGRSTGPHVHYEVRIKDVPKNPLDFVLNFEEDK